MPLLSSFRPLGSSGGMRGKAPLPPTSHLLNGPRLTLRIGQPTDWQAWRDLRSQSRAFLTPWEPIWPGDALTFNAFSGSLRRQWRDWKEGKAYAFFIFKKDGDAEERNDPPPQDPNRSFAQMGHRILTRGLGHGETENEKAGTLIGGLTLSNIERGAAQRGNLGYWLGQSFTRQGYMTEAIGLVATFGFHLLHLHRIEADCMPGNVASRRLLERAGFIEEGLSPSYLRINGAWEDHMRWALIDDER